MDIEFDFKGDPVGGVITKCKDLGSNLCVYAKIQENDGVLVLL